jgi:cation diffusion facilitator family transporter
MVARVGGSNVFLSPRQTWVGIMSNRDTKVLLLYLCINLVVLCSQVTVAYTSDRLALLGHSFHALFDCVGVAVACVAEVYAKETHDKEPFPFGLRRGSVLSTFTNACFLFFTGLFISLEALHRVSSPKRLNSSGLFAVLTFGVIVKVFGILLFAQRGMVSMRTLTRPRRHGSIVYYSALKSDSMKSNMRIVLIGMLADIVRSVGILLASTIEHVFTHCDTVISIFISIAMLRTVVPIIRASAKILLQCAPDSPKTKSEVEKCIRAISTVKGVLEIREERYWSVDGDICVGTFSIRAKEHADEQEILAEVERLTCPVFKYQSIQVEKDPPTTWFLQNSPTHTSSSGSSGEESAAALKQK